MIKIAKWLPARHRRPIYALLFAATIVADIWGFPGIAAKIAATAQALGFGVAYLMAADPVVEGGDR
jgi:hypothetical protein